MTGWGGRARGQARPLLRRRLYRLKRSVDVFPAQDGSLYLLRLGAGDDMVLASPSAEDRALLASLGEFRDPDELRAAVDAAALDCGGVAESLNELDRAGLLEVRDEPRLLDRGSARRYDRQLIYLADLAGAGTSAEVLQMRLRDSRVAILGCGGLGSWVACGLSCAGVGSMILIDDDRIELSNLNRQLLFGESAIGELKTEAAAAALRAHNSSLEIEQIQRRIRGPADLDDVLARKPDLVVCTGDWPPHELPRWVNSACLEAGVPWLGAGQFPPRLRVGPMVLPGRSACHECLEIAVRREHPLYDEIARWRSHGHSPDPSVGPISGVIGSLLASEALHLLVGVFTPASVNTAIVIDLRTMELTREPVTRDPDCPSCRSLAGAGKPTEGVTP